LFKDRIVGEGIINGKPSVRIKVAQSLADYVLGKAPQVPGRTKRKYRIEYFDPEKGRNDSLLF
jgi:hypothetical protein